MRVQGQGQRGRCIAVVGWEDFAAVAGLRNAAKWGTIVAVKIIRIARTTSRSITERFIFLLCTMTPWTDHAPTNRNCAAKGQF